MFVAAACGLIALRHRDITYEKSNLVAYILKFYGIEGPVVVAARSCRSAGAPPYYSRLAVADVVGVKDNAGRRRLKVEMAIGTGNLFYDDRHRSTGYHRHCRGLTESTEIVAKTILNVIAPFTGIREADKVRGRRDSRA